MHAVAAQHDKTPENAVFPGVRGVSRVGVARLERPAQSSGKTALPGIDWSLSRSLDADLAQIIAVWDSLTAVRRESIMAIVSGSAAPPSTVYGTPQKR